MATNEHRSRPSGSTNAEDSKDTEEASNWPKRGVAHWLFRAPPEASFAEVIEAYHTHDSPADVWGER
ncbi:hypothetical protein [Halapricum hydrolyticum]|uniref:Uncharacterized protein n=1 Tax=Halapricum hydrolyticum TaxID=2979991 RepID=A0AAE3IGF5_9EURY|nr:hypothetical protein [Halapricum hydrolyticum]MCU4718981.1 hypothetical protein [Halapricum hydrolyticum]MCU4727910.1 hypothetical protein [Halapricum hydrolyticum]